MPTDEKCVNLSSIFVIHGLIVNSLKSLERRWEYREIPGDRKCRLSFVNREHDGRMIYLIIRSRGCIF